MPGYTYTLTRDTEWMRRAACRDAGPEVFFAHGESNQCVEAIKTFCEWCPVRTTCLGFALHNTIGDQYGIWGGMLASQRQALLREARVRR